jgi:hypothetical protein
MVSPMPVDTLPSWLAKNKDLPKPADTQHLKYLMIGGVALLALLFATYVIVNHQQENSKEQLPEENA